MERLRKVIIAFILIMLFSSCERDILNNYRRDFSGNFQFVTIREDMTINPPMVIDTTLFSGSILPVYSNRKDLVRVSFMPGVELDVAVSEAAYLSLPLLPQTGGIITLAGNFSEGGNKIEFSYRISAGSQYSVNHTVTGTRK